ncbi:hypothetical protein [Streptomyces sp. DSM 40907]|uniref:hypothetical protein n=1 Tax=Streptomyces kutzneri TaxID=3051179 RepID=UPI0028D8B458|nr:hypothetical protein [Streptomyces sp. DSM 40907]
MSVRILGDPDVPGRAGLWTDALTAVAAWSEVRTPARRTLAAREGDRRRPLPDGVPLQNLHD